ncbi:nuclear transport factor 2 family protein [Cellulomonas alba]|uniref:SnoaL-like domain-containing protein n=1 Tax=Cellulomonas alba TaxID=3053467 RepID=A0ABT7SGG2_9CELL|nr:hypothetical protein [Cellulomonas alba]MDM7855283.1 hypothetical protein [Cellulomonas alba]
MSSSHTAAEVRAALETMSGSRSTDVFHDQFLSLDPAAVALVSRDQLARALPARQAMFAAIGATGTTLRHLDVHELDDRHVLATTTWDVDLVDEAAEPLTLESSYLMRRMDGGWRVLVYLNHRDIAAVVAERRP